MAGRQDDLAESVAWRVAPRNKRRFESAAIALPPASIASRIRSVAVHEQ
jgi:hypothetical protein